MSPLPTKKQEVLDRINRDIAEGFRLGILTVDERDRLSRQTSWAVGNPVEWNAIETFHHAHSGFARLFESSETRELLKYLRSSYLKMLAHTNPVPEINWNYKAATAWKVAILKDQAIFLRMPLNEVRELFSKHFVFIPKAGRSKERDLHGDVGSVRLFEWQGLLWAFKRKDETCAVPKGIGSGIPQTGAHMHYRSLASYLLAKALGLQKIIVATDFAYYEVANGVEPGIVMEGAGGDVLLKMQPDLRTLSLQVQLSGIPKDMEQRKLLWESAFLPHRRPNLSIDTFKKPPLALDLVAASWLDYMAAQVDRHSGNIYVKFSRSGEYEGLKLIDNDMAFGTKTEPEELKQIDHSSFCGLPDCIAPGLGPRIKSLAQMMPDADAFWNRCRQGVPQIQAVQPAAAQQPRPPVERSRSLSYGDLPRGLVGTRFGGVEDHADRGGLMQSHGAIPRSESMTELPPPARSEDFGTIQTGDAETYKFRMVPNTEDLNPLACMEEIAGLIRLPEFRAFVARVKIAAHRAAGARPLNGQTVGALSAEFAAAYQQATSRGEVTRKDNLSRQSYWHRIMGDYHATSNLPQEYANPPKSLEEWIRGGQRDH